MGEVADLAVVFAEKFLPSAIGSTGYGGLSSTALDLGDVEVKQSQLSALLLLSGAMYQSSNFR